jgi:MYXO-CTERM domain-containing protein
MITCSLPRSAMMLLTLLALLAALERPASACRCLPAPSVADDVARSTAVFEAEVLGERAGDADVVDLRVTRVFKGSLPDRLSLHPDDCPPYVARKAPDGGPAERRWLVYAREGGGRFYTTTCGRTRPLSQAGDDVAVLERSGSAPVPGPPPETVSSGAGGVPPAAAPSAGPTPAPLPRGCGCAAIGTPAPPPPVALATALVLAMAVVYRR